ncbi:tyrosine-type recombinase/integrase [Pseudomonas sp. PA15(2017)]|uniref:tyrosine-type recombinase/integrase n=1 Tax=Pseudomonas sp. PA15(2017) TaxID=1932111 RepID=UPI000AEF714B|nr:tyrosine-type recombinase/integrase [Pseudomonas sp. PA15(2017)]
MKTSVYSLTLVEFSKLGGLKLQLVTINNQIDIFAGAYALQRYDSGAKPNTIRVDQNAILGLYRFCEDKKINLLQRMAELEPLTIGEIESFSSYCGVAQDARERVSANWYTARVRGAKKFIEYLWLFYEGRCSRNLKELEAAKRLYERMTAGFELYLKTPYKNDKKDKVSLTPELQAKFISIIDPDEYNESNPWKTSRIRWRNYIFLLLLMLGGNRKGETLLLKLNNFQLTGRRKYYDILKSSDIISYPRAETPSVKTYGRQVELHDDFAALVEHYIVNVRKEFDGWQQSSYLFLSYRDGKPMSVHTPNSTLNELIKQYPEFKGLLSPHRLRNTFHDLLNQALDNKFKGSSGLSRKILKAPIQEAAGGWARNSSMPEHYAKGSIQAKVAELQVLLQKKILGSLEGK